jgi:hypothetical protein
METSDVRKRILEVLSSAKRDATERRKRNGEVLAAYEKFLEIVAVPVCHQVAGALKAERVTFVVNTPAGAVRLVSERSADDFVEIRLDTTAAMPQVVVHVEHVRGRERFVDVQPIRAGVLVDQLTDQDVLDGIADAIGVLVER